MTFTTRAGLQINTRLADFMETKGLAPLNITPDTFWAGLAQIVADFTPRNRALLQVREDLQQKINAWHDQNRGNITDPVAYKTFLRDIGYLQDEGADFTIETSGIDPEIATICGPQLVVPVTNARFVLNAANARWGSLYDALYGTDAMGSVPPKGGYDAGRGAQVIAWGRRFLDETFPLQNTPQNKTHATATQYKIKDNTLEIDGNPLKNKDSFIGYTGNPDSPDSVLLKNHDLHVILIFDKTTIIGKTDSANMSDIIMESAISTIVDFEDSVAAVDANDKTAAYSNWLGLMRGDLKIEFQKNGKSITRALADDREFTTPMGNISLKGRALMLVRNVGHLMTTPAILDGQGDEIGEGIMDALFTTTLALHDLRHAGRNSKSSIYIVKPKMHGAEEVAFTNDLFGAVETVLGLPKYTIKMGIMDEERRTSVNLKECIRAARHRVAFINTGFLDRTGDEIHTSMHAGAFLPKAQIKAQPWIQAYENQNVDIGLACGLSGKAQIGKGMWPMPDMMCAMLEKQIVPPQMGANCAWVPSPVAAVLHATHYHRTDVFAVQAGLAGAGRRGGVDALLSPSVVSVPNWTADEIAAEVENNAQGILGYVVRWIDAGIGCSKVPDINDVGLMEDRATCRISSQHIANWLMHDVISAPEVMDIMRRMAEVVDRQNEGEAGYVPMSPDCVRIAFQSACDLVFKGAEQPSGYTEPILHSRRLLVISC